MKNLSIIDKLIRVAITIILIVIASVYNAQLGYVYWGIVGVNFYLLFTSYLSFCYVYYGLGFSSYRTKPRVFEV